jgi:DNA repair exonuclease SbcCD ATPase subunit
MFVLEEEPLEQREEDDALSNAPLSGQDGDEDKPLDPPSEEDSDEPLDIKSIADLAKAIDVDPEYLYSLQFPLSGTDEKVTLGEIKDRLQQAQRQQAEIEQKAKALEQERLSLSQSTRQVQEAQTQFTEEMSKAQREMVALEAKFDMVDWTRLEELDPGRAANERQKLLSQYVAARERLQEAQGKHQQVLQYQQYSAKQYHDQELLRRIPDWQDQKKAAEEVQGVVDMARELGFTDGELMTAVDARHRQVLYMAWKWHQLQKGRTAVERKPPKPLTGGRGLTKGAAAKAKEADLIRKARNSNRREDKTAAAIAVLTNSLK